MKKIKNDTDMLKEYNFNNGIRGKYAKKYAHGTNVVVIEPDVAEYFPDHDSVNDALRGLAKIIKKRGEPIIKKAQTSIVKKSSKKKTIAKDKIL